MCDGIFCQCFIYNLSLFFICLQSRGKCAYLFYYFLRKLFLFQIVIFLKHVIFQYKDKKWKKKFWLGFRSENLAKIGAGVVGAGGALRLRNWSQTKKIKKPKPNFQKIELWFWLKYMSFQVAFLFGRIVFTAVCRHNEHNIILSLCFVSFFEYFGSF